MCRLNEIMRVFGCTFFDVQKNQKKDFTRFTTQWKKAVVTTRAVRPLIRSSKRQPIKNKNLN